MQEKNIKLTSVNNQSFVTAKHGEYCNEKQVFPHFYHVI